VAHSSRTIGRNTTSEGYLLRGGAHALDTPAAFAVLMWKDGTAGDEEFVPVNTAVTVVVP
jgi:hypothetical protein